MTPFRFRLQRVLAFRGIEFQLAEAECRQAEARLRTVQAQQAALAARKAETRHSVTRLSTVSGGTLQPLSDWFHWTEAEAKRLKELEHTLSQELRRRRQALVEAHRKVRLLEEAPQQSS